MSTNDKGDYYYKSLSHLREEFNELAGILGDTGKSAKERERKGENGERKTEKTRSSRLPSANYVMLAINPKSCLYINFTHLLRDSHAEATSETYMEVLND